MYKILLVEDDEAISNSIKNHLENWGFEIAAVRDFRNIINEFNKVNPHIVLLDIILPFYDGYYWCKEVRKISNVPIVFLSSASDNMNMGDWDAVIIAQSSFAKIPISRERQVAKIREEITRIEETIERAWDEEGMPRGAVKNLEKIKKSREAQLKKLLDDDKKDNVLIFENVDEQKVEMNAEDFIAQVKGKKADDYTVYGTPSESRSAKFRETEKRLIERVPEEMRNRPNWVIVRTKPNEEKGRLDKFLIDVHTGKMAN